MPLLLLALLLGALQIMPTLARIAPRPKTKAAEVALVTLNVLGASHTDGGGRKYRRFPGSARRSSTLVTILKDHPADVLALQECQPSQRKAVAKSFRRYAMHWSVDNVIAWDRLRWRCIHKGFVTQPYFGGHPRRMPYVVLQGRRGGRVIQALCTHDPASVHGEAGHWREECWDRQARHGKDYAARDRVLLSVDLGDKNSHGSYLRAVREHGGQVAGIPDIWGNSDKGIDWITGWPKPGKSVRWVGFGCHTSARLKRTTDHPLVKARALI